MTILKERNKQKNIVSDNRETGFAWGSYYAYKSNIFINGTEYYVDIVYNGNVVFDNGQYTGYGNWAIFRNLTDNSLVVYDKNALNEARENNPLTDNLYCFSDDTFLQ